MLAGVGPVAPLDVALHDAVGCILAADVVATDDLPLHPLAARDGYALASVDTEAAGGRDGVSPLHLPVAHDVHPGAAAPLRLAPGQAVRVGSGAPLPVGADAVLALEDTDRGTARVLVPRPVRAGEHVRRAGVDAGAGDVLIAAGTRLGARQLSMAAAVDRARVRVHPTPRVVILSVGDELVEPGSPAQPGAVHDANSHALATAVRDVGASAIRVGVVGDDRARLRETLRDQLVRADLLLTTGGLSETDRDTVKDVLGPLGTVRFDHVAMSPGRRQGFGTVGGDDGADAVPIFALPGHPVAAHVSFEVFVRPALRAMAGRAELFRPSVAASASTGWGSAAGVRQFVPAHLEGSADDGYTISPVGDPAVVSLAALARANALAVVPEDVASVRAGDHVHCIVLEG